MSFVIRSATDTDVQLDFGLDLEPRAQRPRPRTRRVATVSEAPQLPLAFAHPPLIPTRQHKTRVEQILRRIAGPKVLVELTTNRATMLSTRLRRGVLRVRLDSTFGGAPEALLEAVARYVSGQGYSATDGALIDHWIATHQTRIREVRTADLAVQPQGEFHDLEEILSRINATYFQGQVQARITWTRSPRGQKRQTIHLGTYSPDESLIRIHPALDQDFVPDYFVESVVFHEALHELFGITESGGRRCIHPPEFAAAERRYLRWEDARRWEARHLSKLLRY